MSSQNEETAKPRIDGDSYLKLIGDTKAFLEATFFIEERIRELKVEDGNQNRIGGSTGWRIHNVWESLKTASHFNFGIALELRLKCILELCGLHKEGRAASHNLEKIYSLIPDEISRELEDLYAHEMKNRSLKLKAFMRSESEPTDTPSNNDLKNLKDLCIYFDKDVKLWLKRYSWEELLNKTWVHYIEDLSPLMDFVQEAEEIGNRMARELGIVK
ncbi:MAG: hypothetical protein OXH71_05935 [Candidatus Dadabacteria bacterium]|nr:hypothetical protein [Candidatus Dadabacteria bacterium]MDE0520212.1 hypothetical protein [Candidatus Dadabacteria bacterium]MDE0662547.1 hypothetical protein [Candidatus Dadabacteria bacterium]